MALDCPHIAEVRPVPDGGDVCPTCVETGSTWVNLRQCLVCGQVGCCDSSPNTHATKHHQATGHPVIRSLMPGQDWLWCYGCEVQFRSVDGGYRAIDSFFEAGLWFVGQRGDAGIDGVEPGETTEEGFPLGAWITTYRGRARRGELDDDQVAALEVIPHWVR